MSTLPGQYTGLFLSPDRYSRSDGIIVTLRDAARSFSFFTSTPPSLTSDSASFSAPAASLNSRMEPRDWPERGASTAGTRKSLNSLLLVANTHHKMYKRAFCCSPRRADSNLPSSLLLVCLLYTLMCLH